MGFKSGYVAIIGRPNVGKSTLLNALMGEKLAIISDKPQTTRNRIQCVYTDEESQIVFLDTPGMQKGRNKLGDYMEKITLDTVKDVDVILWLVDESSSLGKWDQFLLEELKKLKKIPKIAVLNKSDLQTAEDGIRLYEKFAAMDVFAGICPLSAKENRGVDELIKVIQGLLPEGPQYFPEDTITDQPVRFIAAEIIREKALHYLDQEIPHGIAVEINEMKERKKGEIMYVSATIHCERDSHKGIIIGKGGRKLKGIGKSARIEIEKLLGTQVHLELWVKVSKDWRDKESAVRRFGYK
jgi:GTP-binding protein Era